MLADPHRPSYERPESTGYEDTALQHEAGGIAFEWDEAKREQNALKHKLDFGDAILIWGGRVIELRSDRGAEERWVSIGVVGERIVAVVWTRRGNVRRLISVRAARRHERKDYEDDAGAGRSAA